MTTNQDNNLSSPEAIKAQLDVIEKYVNKDLDRMNTSIIDAYKKINELERSVDKFKGALITLGATGTLIGTLVGWALQHFIGK